MLDALGSSARLAQEVGPGKAIVRAAWSAGPLYRAYAALRYIRHSGELYRTELREGKWAVRAGRQPAALCVEGRTPPAVC